MMKTDNRGAASVLVIFMMLVLVTLGAFAITSANANYKLSRRAIQWNAMYYGLDAQGETFLSLLDAKLAEAETAAGAYVLNKAEIPEWLESEIQAQGLKITDAFNAVYLYYADKYLTELSFAPAVPEVYAIDNGLLTNSILLQLNIKSTQAGDDLCALQISIWVEPADLVTMTGDAPAVTHKNNGLRYRIEDWYEYQEPSQEEESGAGLWDGTIN